MSEIEKRAEQTIRFLGEQDGEPERQLKSTLRGCLASSPGVQRAYLARVAYGVSAEPEVALCLVAPESPSLVRAVAAEFARLFGPSVHLDILFLNSAQESECRQVCNSFYEAG